MLDIVPRQMLLIFKMNDCLRHVDNALGSPTNTLVSFVTIASFFPCKHFSCISLLQSLKIVAGKYASERVLDSDKRKHKKGRFIDMFRSWLSYVHVMFRIKTYELWNGMLVH